MPSQPERWTCLRDARAASRPRLPFRIDGQPVGSVAVEHLESLRGHATLLAVGATGVDLIADAAVRNAELQRLHLALRAQGLIRAWRDETYAIVTRHGAQPLALIERAAARFWGTLTFGAHCNGFLADDAGRPTHLWIARRSRHKPTDPGRLDNLVGGGVPHGQSPFEALVREGFEEAGLDENLMRRAVPGGVVEIVRDVPEGLQREQLFAHDLRLSTDTVPRNQDGEVEELRCLPVAEAIECAAAGEMTVDAALVTLDFALRHGLLAADEVDALRREFDALRVN